VSSSRDTSLGGAEADVVDRWCRVFADRGSKVVDWGLWFLLVVLRKLSCIEWSRGFLFPGDGIFERAFHVPVEYCCDACLVLRTSWFFLGVGERRESRENFGMEFRFA